ncbi:DOA4-independent degradation protein 4 [Sphaceloma murrayae]|uniref:DOA4-independent degradation protein 4 n=1 Tax=Sphaceloma murrayae TaxID=2082308 RepID=A0A2K1QFU8_9PEZI|nr:DOA4-independent degradation protein 4 [Sphaceloma murrayae]
MSGIRRFCLGASRDILPASPEWVMLAITSYYRPLLSVQGLWEPSVTSEGLELAPACTNNFDTITPSDILEAKVMRPSHYLGPIVLLTCSVDAYPQQSPEYNAALSGSTNHLSNKEPDAGSDPTNITNQLAGNSNPRSRLGRFFDGILSIRVLPQRRGSVLEAGRVGKRTVVVSEGAVKDDDYIPEPTGGWAWLTGSSDPVQSESSATSTSFASPLSSPTGMAPVVLSSSSMTTSSASPHPTRVESEVVPDRVMLTAWTASISPNAIRSSPTGALPDIVVPTTTHSHFMSRTSTSSTSSGSVQAPRTVGQPKQKSTEGKLKWSSVGQFESLESSSTMTEHKEASASGSEVRITSIVQDIRATRRLALQLSPAGRRKNQLSSQLAAPSSADLLITGVPTGELVGAQPDTATAGPTSRPVLQLTPAGRQRAQSTLDSDSDLASAGSPSEPVSRNLADASKMEAQSTAVAIDQPRPALQLTPAARKMAAKSSAAAKSSTNAALQAQSNAQSSASNLAAAKPKTKANVKGTATVLPNTPHVNPPAKSSIKGSAKTASSRKHSAGKAHYRKRTSAKKLSTTRRGGKKATPSRKVSQKATNSTIPSGSHKKKITSSRIASNKASASTISTGGHKKKVASITRKTSSHGSSSFSHPTHHSTEHTTGHNSAHTLSSIPLVIATSSLPADVSQANSHFGKQITCNLEKLFECFGKRNIHDLNKFFERFDERIIRELNKFSDGFDKRDDRALDESSKYFGSNQATVIKLIAKTSV